jgi:mono/diheme cytochrome c family protein
MERDRRRRPAWTAPVAVIILLLTPAGARGADGEGRYIELWTGVGQSRTLLERVDLDALPLREVRVRDPQYGAEVRARAIALAEVWGRAAVPSQADLALLRFDNGLQIPLPFRDPLFMQALAPMIARATSTGAGGLQPGRIADTRRPPTEEDLRPLSFHGNKVIVADPQKAPVLPSVRDDLKPWLYADSLFAIELVERVAWEAQLDAGAATQEGKRVFLGSCRFCHAVRGVGGALGWDFVDPVPIYSEEWLKRFKAGSDEINPMPARTMLSIHVRHRAPVGGTRTMPALRGMRLPEVQALWDWLQAISGRPKN